MIDSLPATPNCKISKRRRGVSGCWNDCAACQSSALTADGSIPTAVVGIRSHGHANTGMELAWANHSPGRRRERNRAKGAAAAGAELDLDKARDASAAGAVGTALFDARRGLARIWRCGAPASRLDARTLCPL